MATKTKPKETEQMKPVRLNSSEAWQRWLEKHSGKSAEAWLTIRKKGAKAGVPYEEAVEEALCFGWIDGKAHRYNEETFLVRFSPRKSESVWSQINKEKAQALIEAGKMTEAGLASIEQAKRNGQWDRAYTSKVKPPLPADLEQALKRRPAALNNFNGLSNSAQLMYIVWVENAKRPETRKRRIEQVVERSLQNRRPGE